jgi:signal peptidase II
MQAARGASLNSGDDDIPESGSVPANTSASSSGGTAGDASADVADEADVDATRSPVGSVPAEAVQEPGRFRRFLVVAGVAYAVDQLTKAVAVARLEGESAITAVPGVLDLRFLRNPGAAFGLATDLTWLLSLAAIAVAVAVVIMARRVRDRIWAVGLGLLFAGAVGNLTDRIFREPAVLRGHVVDFLELPHWPVFNVADMALTSACVLIALQSFRGISVDGAGPRRSTR